VQACCRSLIVDTLPIPKQQLGSAWASRMSAIGHLIGYGIGTLDLRSIWGDVLGDTQFKQLCAIAGLALIFACGATSYCVKERVLISSKYVPAHHHRHVPHTRYVPATNHIC
jgi:solute carrier family 45 protein 1/2/4